MPRFLYYLPLPGVNRQLLTERGLLDRFQGEGGRMLEYVVASCNHGPDGKMGCVFGLGASHPAYDSKAQRWAQGPGFWVGVEDAPPMPEDLVREVGIEGPEIRLADGNAWRVPRIHRWDVDLSQHVPNLPKAIVPVPSAPGEYRCETRVKAEYAKVDEIARRTFAGFVEERSVTIESMFADAVAILAVNYRLGMEEAGLLGLLDTETAQTILEAAIDLPTMQACAHAKSQEGLEYSDPVIHGDE